VYVSLFTGQLQTTTTTTEQWTTEQWTTEQRTTVSFAPAQSDNSGSGASGTINNNSHQ